MVKSSKKVHWYEGMQLSSQHFQQSDMNVNILLQNLISNISPYYYGVIDLEWEIKDLNSSFIRLKKFKAVMPDCTIINSDDLPYPLELNLQNFMGREFITIYCVLSESEITYFDGINVERYTIITSDNVKDYNDTNNLTQLSTIIPKCYLVADQVPARHIALPILKLSLIGSSISVIAYTPPSLNIKFASSIINHAKSLIQILKTKLLRKYDAYKLSGEKQEYMFDLLHGLLPLEASLLESKIHPHDFFMNLLNLCAYLSKVGDARLIHTIPAYNHDDLLKSFTPLLNFIEHKLNLLQEDYTLIATQYNNNVYEILLDINENSEIDTLSFLMQFNVEDDLENKWIESAVIASESNFDLVRQNRILGARRHIHSNLISDSIKNIVVHVEIDDYININEKLCITNSSVEFQPITISWMKFTD